VANSGHFYFSTTVNKSIDKLYYVIKALKITLIPY